MLLILFPPLSVHFLFIKKFFYFSCLADNICRLLIKFERIFIRFIIFWFLPFSKLNYFILSLMKMSEHYLFRHKIKCQMCANFQ